jgi:dihydrofolate reductase
MYKRKLTAYNFISLDGYFKGPGGDTSWHRHGEEENRFAVEAMEQENILVYGRITYELMESYWPTAMAIENDPVIAMAMNSAEKIVFSNTLHSTEWNNTRILSGDIIEQIKKMKQTDGKDLTILGSGSIVTQFTDEGLIDEYQIMVDPVALGEGTPIFSGLKEKLELELRSSRQFNSGVTLLCYTLRKN